MITGVVVSLAVGLLIYDVKSRIHELEKKIDKQHCDILVNERELDMWLNENQKHGKELADVMARWDDAIIERCSAKPSCYVPKPKPIRGGKKIEFEGFEDWEKKYP